jgi:hypothetical protein
MDNFFRASETQRRMARRMRSVLFIVSLIFGIIRRKINTIGPSSWKFRFPDRYGRF